jgi:small subunit ribosomal protein S16
MLREQHKNTMSVTIRLALIGKRNQPSYRIVAANTRSKRNGEFLETIGSYNPMTKPEHLSFDKDKLKLWQDRGALMTESVKKLLEGTYTFALYPSAKKVKREAKKAAEKAAKASGGAEA